MSLHIAKTEKGKWVVVNHLGVVAASEFKTKYAAVEARARLILSGREQ